MKRQTKIGSRLSVTLLIAVAFTFSAACNKSGNTSSTNSSTNSSATSSATSSPSAAVRGFYEAISRNDVAGAKRYLSAGWMSRREAQLKGTGKTVDMLLQENIDSIKLETTPKVSNEKISGDTATVEVTNNGNGNSITMPLVKEGGEWKLELDKSFVNQSPSGSPSGTPTQTPAEDNN